MSAEPGDLDLPAPSSPERDAEGGAAGDFPPIADYAFLSDCETCALVASGGRVEWLCLPRPDSPSVFGAMLDRSAGVFGLVPEGIEVPSHRRYLPGSMVLETTWQTPTGWLQVYDCLVTHRWHGGKRHAHYKRAPGDFVAAGTLLVVATCVDGDVEVLLNCLPVFDYGREPGGWGYAGEGYDAATIRGPRGDGSGRAQGGRERLRGALVGRGRCPGFTPGCGRSSVEHDPGLAPVAEGRDLPGPSLAKLPGAQRADAQGAELRADRRGPGGRHHLVAGDPGRGAQLGLPVHVGSRLGLHAVGALHPGLRMGGLRVLRLRHGGGVSQPASDHVRNRRRARAARGATGPPLGLCGGPPGSDRQRRLRPEAARRLGHAGGLDRHPCPPRPHPADAEGRMGDDRRVRRRRGRALVRAR